MPQYSDIMIDHSRAMTEFVDSDGVSEAELTEIEPKVLKCHTKLLAERNPDKKGEVKRGFYTLYKDKKTFNRVLAKAAHFGSMGHENLVVLGIGGSALGLTALNTALNPPYYNLLSSRQRKGRPRLFVMDNVDPVTFKAMMALCPPGKTLYNVISKSGETAETIAQLMIIVEELERAVGKDNVKRHLVVTSSPNKPGAPKSLLHPVATQYHLDSFVIPVNVGGRFSVFSPVGLFPAAVLGLDIKAMIEGCKAMDKRCSLRSLRENPAYLRAAVHHILNTKKGKTMSVMMPYADGLRDVADWYRQLWAESLGKRKDLQKKDVHVGQTPIKALGVTDQHSQLQLYSEGPNNKVFNFLEVAHFDVSLPIPNTLPTVPDVDYLRGKSMNRLIAAEMEGTIEALTACNRPVIKVTLPEVNAHTIAQLLYMLEVETAMAGRLYNINAFDQPGVELSKKNTRAILRREE